MAGRTKSLNTEVAARAEETPGWLERLRSPALICTLLALITFVVFLPVVWNDFVNYDDPDYVTANAHVQTGLKWSNLVWAFQTGHASNWHPLTWLSHMLDCQLFGQRAGAHHLMGALFHTVNTVLVFLVLNGMTGALWRSALVAALFGLHPLHVESVAWISERKDLLSGFFFLLTLGAYARYVEQSKSSLKSESAGGVSSVKGGGRGTKRASGRMYDRAGYYFLALFFFAVGLMSKPMLVTVPFVLLLLDWWPFRRIDPRISQSSNESLQYSPTPILRLLLEKAPFLALAAVSCVITFVVQRKGGAVSTSISLGARIANTVVSYARYIGKTFWPFDLSVLYPHPGLWPATSVIGSTAIVLLISGGLFVLARKATRLRSDESGMLSEGRPWLIVGWFWFLGTLVPVIGLVQVGIQSMADRYTYLPLIGLFIIVVWGGAEILGRWQHGREKSRRLPGGASLNRLNLLKLFSVSIPIVILAACALRTADQLHIWRNSETLFRHATGVTRNNFLAYNNLGFYLSNRGKVQEAMENYRKALEIKPAYEDAHNNLGYALAAQKKYPEAIAHYNVALKIRPDHVEVHNNLGNALSETGRIEEAIQHYLFVLEHKPDHADAHNNLGIALAMQGKLEEAMPHFHAAIRIKKDYAGAHSNLGNALAAQHRLSEAIQEYQEALRLKPDDAQAHNNLGNVLTEQGKIGEAIMHYQEALRLNADNPEAHFNLGMALARQSNREEAAHHFREALRLKPDYPEARRALNSLVVTGQNPPP